MAGKGQDTETLITQPLLDILEETGLPGFAVAYVNQDSILYCNGFGFSDVVDKSPFTSKTVLNIGSTSKTFIGVAILKLLDQGKLKLDESINFYLPFKVQHPNYPNVPITLRQLATHTSGIVDRPSTYEFRSYYLVDEAGADAAKKGLPLKYKVFLNKISGNQKEALGGFLKNTLEVGGSRYTKKSFHCAAPGQKYEYSNIGSALAAYVVECVSEKSYSEYTKETIFDNFQMNSSGWSYEDFDINRFAARYIGKKMMEAPQYDIVTYPDGGLKTTIDDLAKYVQQMIRGYNNNNDYLTVNSWKELFTNQLSNSHGERRALFWDVFGTQGVGEIGHSGSDPGIRTFMYFNPESGVGKILLVNSSETEAATLTLWEKIVALEKTFH